MAIDFEAEGLTDGLQGSARESRLRLLEDLSAQGFTLEELRSAAGEGRLALLPLERVLQSEERRYTAEQMAELSGQDRALLDQAWRALGVPEPAPDEVAFTEEDLEGARTARRILSAGVSEERFLELTRLMSQSMAVVAAAVVEVFGDELMQPGDTERDLGLRYAEAMRELGPTLGPTLVHMLSLRLREQIRQAVVGSAELESGHLPGAQPVAVCFADIVGFTSLGEQIPVSELGSIVGRLETLAADVATPPVRLVKTIGDAAMLVAPEAAALLDAALTLVEAADADGDFPRLRAGAAFGEALTKGGDWYGQPVNLASRITGVARPSSVLVDREVKAAADGRYDFSFAGRRRLKGVGEVPLFRARRSQPDDAAMS